MKTLLWELRSDSGILARCLHEHDASAENVVTVTVGGVEPFREHYRTEADAHDASVARTQLTVPPFLSRVIVQSPATNTKQSL